jgi:hypothetical protein
MRSELMEESRNVWKRTEIHVREQRYMSAVAEMGEIRK